MSEFFAVVGAAVIVFMFGVVVANDSAQNACVNKYADMPHNQVQEHCKKILKFEKN